MVQGSFVLSGLKNRKPQQLKMVQYRQTKMRYFVIVMAIFVVFGCEYCFDNASALQKPIESNLSKSGNDITQAEFNLLYALYAFPNIIIPLIGGIVIDKYGARIALIITSMFCVVGHFIFGLGGYKNIFGLMLAGRVVFGIGGEVLHAAQNTLISTWFKASQLSIVLGICLSFPKMGSSLNSYISPKLSNNFGEVDNLNVAGPIFIGVILMCVSVLIGILLAYFDRKSEQLQKQSQVSQFQGESQRKPKSLLDEKSREKSQQSKPQVKVVLTSQLNQNQHTGVQQHLNFKQIGKLPMAFWLILIISMLAQALFIPFLDNGNAYYVDIFDLADAQDAGIYLILPYCVSSLFVVIFGYLVEKFQKRSYVLMGSCFLFVLTYLFMMFIECTQNLRSNSFVRWLPSFLLGILIAIFCSIIVPTVPMLISPKLLGTGFGLMEMLQNLALGVFPLIGGAIRQTQSKPAQGFHLQTSFFFLISCLLFGVSLLLKAVDVTSGRKLDVKDFRKQYLKQISKVNDEQM